MMVIDTLTTTILSAEETGGRFGLFRVDGPAGSGVPPHIHTNEDETFYVISGRVEYISTAGTKVLGPGEAFFAARGEMHGFRMIEASETLVQTAPVSLEAMFEELAALPEGPPDLAAIGAICARYGISFA